MVGGLADTVVIATPIEVTVVTDALKEVVVAAVTLETAFIGVLAAALVVAADLCITVLFECGVGTGVFDACERGSLGMCDAFVMASAHCATEPNFKAVISM